jgi:hypothetical protein
MTELHRDFLEALQCGIDAERAACGQEAGPPYTGGEWDCAAATTLAMNVLRAPFHQRRAKLVQMQKMLFDDGFFQLARIAHRAFASRASRTI